MTNPAPNGDVNPSGSDDNAPAQGSDQPNTNPNPKLQSERDKLREMVKRQGEELEQLKGSQMQTVFKDRASEFLKKNQDKFGDVEVDDLYDTEDLTDEAFEKVAKKAQGKYDRVRNKAIADVQTVPDGRLSEEEAEKEIETLSKEQREKGHTPGNFQKFLGFKQRTKR